ncbi:MAG: TonB-dependent receptor [Betaproteobacteria bacterium]|nr:TonB-dependent receptor [Betaproteobacteria bacterium]
MMRDMRRLACVALFFVSVHPATGLAQSQKSQIWRIPVLPSDEARNSPTPPSPFGLVPSPERARLFQRLVRPGEETQVSAQELSTSEAAVGRSRTLNDALAQLGLLSVGGESGAWGGGRVSMRGFPGREPEALLEGVSLGTGFTGANAIELVPGLAVASVQAYPFLPGLGLPRRGLAGAYDLSLKAGSQKYRRESLLRIEKPESLVLGHRQERGCTDSSTSVLGCVQLAWQLAVRAGVQMVKDDNNTPLFVEDDFESRLRYNDLHRTGLSVRSSKSTSSGILLDTLTLLGAENRGINGLPVALASSDNRSRKIFGLVTHRASSLSPETGRTWRARGDVRIDSVLFSTRQNTQDQRLRNDERTEKAFGVGMGMSQPADLGLWSGRFFLNGNFENNLFSTRFGLGADVTSSAPNSGAELIADSTLDGRLTVADLGVGYEFVRQKHVLLRLEVFAQLMSTRQSQICGAFSPQVLCAAQSSGIAQTSPGAAVEVQWSASQQTVLYALTGRSTRLPTPAELAGRPDGVAANLDLKPEAAIFSELGAHTPFLHAGVFFSRDSNLIALRQINPYLVRHFNSSRVHRGGLFGRAELRISQLELETAHEQIWARAFAEGSFSQEVPFVPQRHSRGTIRWQMGNTNAAAGHGFFALHLTQTGSYTLDPEAIYRLSPPPLLAFEAVGLLQPASEVLQASLRIDNLLDARTSRLALKDKESLEVAWSYLPALPIMGRSIVFSLKLLTS